jgi:ubiquinone/menaquinone biosynthesis C-methylase UbiE
MEPHEEKWLAGQGAEMMAALGVTESDTVVDFGCGKGRYTIPLSQAVGPNGLVIAIERTAEEIAELKTRMKAFPTSAPVRTIASSTVHLDTIEDSSVDALLAFDVLQYIENWDRFFTAVRGVLRPSGRLHVYPASVPHPGEVDIERLTGVLKELGFSLTAKTAFKMMHNKHMVDDHVLSFSNL